MDFRNILNRGAGRVVQQGESLTEAGVNTAKAVAKEATKDIAKQVGKRIVASLAAAAAPFVVPILVVVLPLVIILILMLAVSAGTAGELTGVNNPREPEGPEEQLPPGEIPPPATGDCAPLANASKLTYSYSNDRIGVPLGSIKREIGYLPDDPIGEEVPLNPSICNGLVGLVVSKGTRVHLTAVLNHHSRLVAGSNRISRHWTGNAIDTTNIEAVAQYFFQHRAALGVRQIITGQFQEYNVDGGEQVPWSRWSPAIQSSHYNHIHIGW